MRYPERPARLEGDNRRDTDGRDVYSAFAGDGGKVHCDKGKRETILCRSLFADKAATARRIRYPERMFYKKERGTALFMLPYRFFIRQLMRLF